MYLFVANPSFDFRVAEGQYDPPISITWWDVFHREEAAAFVGELYSGCFFYTVINIYKYSAWRIKWTSWVSGPSLAPVSSSSYTRTYATTMSSPRQVIMSFSPSIPLATFKLPLRNVVYTLSYWKTPHQPIVSVSHKRTSGSVDVQTFERYIIATEYEILKWCLPIPVAVRSKAWICCLSFAEIAGSNPAWRMDVCLLWVLCIVRVLCLGRSLVHRSPNNCGVSRCVLEMSKKRRLKPTRGCRDMKEVLYSISTNMQLPLRRISVKS